MIHHRRGFRPIGRQIPAQINLAISINAMHHIAKQSNRKSFRVPLLNGEKCFHQQPIGILALVDRWISANEEILH